MSTHIGSDTEQSATDEVRLVTGRPAVACLRCKSRKVKVRISRRGLTSSVSVNDLLAPHVSRPK